MKNQDEGKRIISKVQITYKCCLNEPTGLSRYACTPRRGTCDGTWDFALRRTLGPH